MKLLHVASLNRVKDQPTLLDALSILKRERFAFEMRVIGYDTLGGEIQRLATRLGLDEDVRFLSVIGHDTLREHYEWADILVMASRHEAGPLVMLEAAVAGIPTVGTRVGHLADQAPEGAVGVPVGDAVALAQAIGAIATDESRRLGLARTAQAFAVRHDAAFTARAFTQIYREVSAATEA